MQKHSYTIGNTTFDYYLHGTSPQLTIHSGTHGDEYEVIELIAQAINKYLPELPDFVYIPIVSPSAVKLKTRTNDEGLDLNRSFTYDSPSEEAQAVMQFTRDHPTPIIISFHEDLDFPHFYLYDTPGDLSLDSNFTRFKKEISDLGVPLLNGLDDPDDNILQFQFTDGYRACSYLESLGTVGTFCSWALSENLITREFMPEIPGSASQKIKNSIVDAFFRHIVLSLHSLQPNLSTFVTP